MSKYDPERFGETTREGTAYAWTWELAAKRDAESPCPPGARWVPRDVIYLKDGVSPRVTDEEAVERYAAAFDELPPITVQRGTFTLIDGRHRLEGAYRASSEVIRIREVDVDDEDLAVEAFRANLEHGKPYTMGERITGLKLLLQREPWATMSSVLLGREVGLNRNTVDRYRPQGGPRIGQDGKEYLIRPADRPSESPGESNDRDQGARFEQRDRKSPPPKLLARTFDPGQEYDGDEWGTPKPKVAQRPNVDPETGELVDDDDHIHDANSEVDGGVILWCTLDSPARADGGVLNPASLLAAVRAMQEWLDGLVEAYS